MQLREYQRRCLDAIYEYFRVDTGNPLVIVPTGGGKSLVIAALCHDIMQRWPGQRVLILSHVKELVQQDYDKLKAYWSKAPAGIYSASLKSRNSHHPITLATIQSVFKKGEILGHRDIAIIDECHLVSRKDDGMYLTLLNRLRETNPSLKVIGLSATPYRLDSGMLHEGDGRIFTDVAVEVPIQELLDRRFLTRLVSKSSVLQADLRNVGLIGGEFNSKQMEAAFDSDAFTAAVLDEVLTLAAGRKAVLFFCTGVDHAQHVRDGLRARGVAAEMVTGKTPADERDALLRGFREGRIPALTSVNVVATGFDAPNVDCLVLLRATMSPGLFVQMVGRGLRIAPGKTDCLVLDYGTNVERHGPITHVTSPRRQKGRRKAGEVAEEGKPMVRICELCRTASPLDALECPECGNPLVKERDPTAKLETEASAAPIVMTDDEYLEKSTVWADVDRVSYKRHRKEGKPDSLRVEYQCGMMVYKEWVCLEHTGYAQRKATQWMNARLETAWSIPDSVVANRPNELIDIALDIQHHIRRPARIRVRKKDKHFEVIAYDFNTEPARQTEFAIGA